MPGEPQRDLITILVLICSLLTAPAVFGDWINLTGAETSPSIAEITVHDDRVELALEMYIADLKTFELLIPDDWLKDRNVQRSPMEERLQRFASETFQMVTETGERLSAELKRIEPRMRKDRKSPFAGMINPYTRQRVPEAPEDKRVVYAELAYAFTQRPEALTIIPPLDEEGRPLVTIGFIAYHKSVPIIDFRYLGAPARVVLDWEDPWYTKFDNPNLKRHHKDALMSFLYVEPYEVRHEILTRVKDMAQWIDLDLRRDAYIEPDELGPLKRRIGEFLLTRNRVLVDGKPLNPILDRTNYVKLSLTGIRLVEQPERLETSTAIVGVIITYLTEGMPQEVTVDWDLFTDQIRRVPATSIDPAGPLPSYVEPQDNVHKWTNFLKSYRLPRVERVAVDDSLTTLSVPLGSLLCLAGLGLAVARIRARRRQNRSIRVPLTLALVLVVAGVAIYPLARVSVARPAAMAPTLTDADAHLLLQTLLKNVYRAFDFRDEEDVYDKLALSVSGDLLAEIYLQSRKSLAIQKAGGAQAKVKAVEVLNVDVARDRERALTYRLDAEWTALGTVGHWGHVHMRKNHYHAVLTLEAVGDAWRIADLEVIEERRVDPYIQPVVASRSAGR